MVTTRMLAAAAVMVGLVAPTAGSGQSAGPAPPGDVASGKALYMKETCHFCHGTAAHGSITGPRLAATARNLDGFTRYVRRPSGSMPAFTDRVVTDQELGAIFAYLKALPAARPVAEIPLLDKLKDE